MRPTNTAPWTTRRRRRTRHGDEGRPARPRESMRRARAAAAVDVARGTPLTQRRVGELTAGPAPSSCAGGSRGWMSGSSRPGRLKEVSLGDFVLSGGEIAALALVDACVRLLPGVNGQEISGAGELRGAACWSTALHTAATLRGLTPSGRAAVRGSPQDRGLAARTGRKTHPRTPPDLWQPAQSLRNQNRDAG